MLDKSFQALVLSLLAHALLTLVLLKGLPDDASKWDTALPIEVIYDDAEKSKKNFVTDSGNRSPLEELKRQANYLSRLTQRVKEEMKARKTGQTKNRAGTSDSESDENRARGVGGLGLQPTPSRPLATTEAGPRSGLDGSANPLGRQVVVGQSTVGEHIPGVKEGAFTALNTDRYLYYTFFSRVNEQVRNRWVAAVRSLTSQLSDAELKELSQYDRVSQIEIVLDKKGQFVASHIFKSSGFPDLDQVAVGAFKDAAPFPNPPQEMIEADGKLHLHYGFMVQFTPQRWVGVK